MENEDQPRAGTAETNQTRNLLLMIFEIFGRLFCFLSCLLFLISLATVLSFFVIFLASRSSHWPTFHINTISLSIPNDNVSTSEITANWTINLSIENPREAFHVEFNDGINYTVCHEAVLLLVATSRRFEIWAGQIVMVNGSLGSSQPVHVGNREKAVEFEVKVEAMVAMYTKTGFVFKKRKWTKAHCEIVEVESLLEGKVGNMSGAEVNCNIILQEQG